MTEIGMALSNPLEGERRPGHVGLPLPGVEVRLAGDSGRSGDSGQGGGTGRGTGDSRGLAGGRQGEIEVRGPQVFKGYWGRPEETAAAFRHGWFRTGDEARLGRGGYYRILGRRSIDIVKTGGYKVSALEVEAVYRAHPAVRDIAVVGVAHAEWGEQLHAAWVPATAGGTRSAGAHRRSRTARLGQGAIGLVQGPPRIHGGAGASPQRDGEGAESGRARHVGGARGPPRIPAPETTVDPGHPRQPADLLDRPPPSPALHRTAGVSRVDGQPQDEGRGRLFRRRPGHGTDRDRALLLRNLFEHQLVRGILGPGVRLGRDLVPPRPRSWWRCRSSRGSGLRPVCAPSPNRWGR